MIPRRDSRPGPTVGRLHLPRNRRTPAPAWDGRAQALRNHFSVGRGRGQPFQAGCIPKILQQYRRLIVAGAASAVPLAAALVSLTPVWPSGIAEVTAVAQFLVLALVFQLLTSARRHVVSRIMVRATIILCVLVPIYLMLIALFTYSEPISKMRFTKGFECTERAKQVFSKECPFLGTDEISTAGYEADTLWTTRSVAAVKSLIVVMWLACFAALSTVLRSFAVFQMGQKN